MVADNGVSEGVERARITMLGASNSGKTTFLLGMYYVMRGLFGDYSLRAERDVDIALKHTWRRIARPKGREWPLPNDEKWVRYDFSFSRNLEALIQFEWLDYRGGALDALTSDPDVPEILKQASQSTCLFLTVAGDALIDDTKGREFAIRDQVLLDEMIQLVQDANKPPLVILVTKADLCSVREPDDARLLELLVEDVKGLAPALFQRGGGWRVMVCPVTLGADLVNDSAAELEPKNLHVPLIFAIQALFDRERESIEASVDEVAGQLRETSSRQAAVEARWGTKVGLNRGERGELQSVVSGLAQELSAGEERLARVAETADALASELSAAALFIDGQRVRPRA